MVNAVMSQLGVSNAATPANYDEANALFLKTFTGEVMTAFDELNVFGPLHTVRTITEGKSASFNYMGKATARYHVAGTPIVGSNKIPHAEKIINIDDRLIADVTIDDLEEAKNHYDIRGEYAKQLGAALAREWDVKIARLIALAARATNPITSLPGGSRLTNAAAKTDGQVISDLFWTAAQTLDEKDVWEGERYGSLLPAQYYLAAKFRDNMDRDIGGVGSRAKATLPEIAGIMLVKTNNVPTANISASVSGEQNDYTGDFRTTAGMIFQKQAVGTVKLQDMATQMTGADYAYMYQGVGVLAKYVQGSDWLRPDAAIELATGAVA